MGTSFTNRPLGFCIRPKAHFLHGLGHSRDNSPSTLVGAAGYPVVPTNGAVETTRTTSRPYKWSSRGGWNYQSPLKMDPFLRWLVVPAASTDPFIGAVGQVGPKRWLYRDG